MAITFSKARREGVSLMLGLAGPSSSGKTMSSLRIATGLANGGPIYFIDTEARRGLHYAGMFDFHHAELTEPFSPDRYLEAIQTAYKAGAKVIIVDSMSHCHEGKGGILDMHEQELERMAGNDYAKRERVKFAAWIKPKAANHRLVNTLLQIPVHFIFDFRAKDKLVLVKNAKGAMEPISAGWQPIVSDRFEYEQTMMLVLPAGARGVPDLNAQATKLQEQHRPFVSGTEPLSEETGRALAEWAGGAPSTAHKPGDKDPIFDIAQPHAAKGRAALTVYWKALSKTEKAAFQRHGEELGRIADAADAEITRTADEEAARVAQEDAEAKDALPAAEERKPAQQPTQPSGDLLSAAGGLSAGFWDGDDLAIAVPQKAGKNSWMSWESLMRSAVTAARDDGALRRLEIDNAGNLEAFSEANGKAARLLGEHLAERRAKLREL